MASVLFISLKIRTFIYLILMLGMSALISYPIVYDEINLDEKL